MNKPLLYRTIVIILLCILCFFGAAFGYGLLLKFLEDHFEVRVVRSGSIEETIEDLLYLFTVTILPLFVISLWKFIPVYSTKRKGLSVLIVLGCLFLSLSLRIVFIIRNAQLRRQQFVQENASSYRFPAPLVYAAALNLWFYVIAALLVSAGFVYLLLREQKKEVIAFSFEKE